MKRGQSSAEGRIEQSLLQRRFHIQSHGEDELDVMFVVFDGVQQLSLNGTAVALGNLVDEQG